MEKPVKIWEEDVHIPTYPACDPEKGPLFIEKRAYQGSTGKIYPIPVVEKISDDKEDHVWHAVFLENEYLKIMVLPELGGRIQRAYDKTNGYDFVYYNHVIKPALVGLAGPWISGGIEFNWPQHHRPSTYMPVDYTIQEDADGSCAVFVGETDRMYGTKGMAEIRLYPGKAYIEIRGQLYNPTDLPQTFLWWANPAVSVNDHTFSVFPPDVSAVMDHGKRAVSTFPIATGEYYKVDYSAGVDISRYRNVPVPTSFMAAHSDFDFIGNYDEEKEAGLLHVADHHISPGKKQWTWGNGDFGRTWDRNLTDADGPYIELMTGVFTDNQPDFSWLKPHEEKVFRQYFMPYKGVGRIDDATKDAAVSLVPEQTEEPENPCGNAQAILKVYVTAKWEHARIEVTGPDGEILYEYDGSLSPEECFCKTIDPGIPTTACHIKVYGDGKELLHRKPFEKELQPVPAPADALPAPKDVASLEDLYLAATHLEQYRHATYEPADYYEEGLRRDPSDIRLNNGYGLLLYRRGLLKESLQHFRAAVKKQTWKTPNPYHGEGYFNLGLALEALGQDSEAFDAFYKSTWSAETQSSGFYHLARLAAKKGCLDDAAEFTERSLIRNWHNMNARMLKAAVLRRLEDNDSRRRADPLKKEDCDSLPRPDSLRKENCDSLPRPDSLRKESSDNKPAVDFFEMDNCGSTVRADFLKESMNIDPLHMGCRYEQALLDGSLNAWKSLMRKDPHNYLILADEYRHAGMWQEAKQILTACPRPDAMVWYMLADTLEHLVQDAETKEAIQLEYPGQNKEAQEVVQLERIAQNTEAQKVIRLEHPGQNEEAQEALRLEQLDQNVEAQETSRLERRDQNKEVQEVVRLEHPAQNKEVQEAIRKAEASCPDTCFPNRLEEMCVLQHIIETYDKVPMANYYLGNLLYDKKQYAEAAHCWEQTVAGKPEFAMAYRNLSIYHYNKTQEFDKAEREIRKVCSLEPDYPRFLLEQDQLLARNHKDFRERLALLEDHLEVTAQRDDLFLRYISLLNCAGRYSEAEKALSSRQFHPWEGGEGKVSAQYRLALTQLARKEMASGNFDKAVELLKRTLTYPENLGEGKLPNTPDQMSWYYLGEALRGAYREERMPLCSAGQEEGVPPRSAGKEEETPLRIARQEEEIPLHSACREEAIYWYRKAAENLGEPKKVLYYNDQPSDYIYYQGLAMRALGDEAGARGAFHRLLAFGEQHLFDEVSYDYFAVSLPEIEIYQEDLKQRNDQYCNYLRALGHAGLGEKEKALALIREILRIQPDHQGALVLQEILEN